MQQKYVRVLLACVLGLWVGALCPPYSSAAAELVQPRGSVARSVVGELAVCALEPAPPKTEPVCGRARHTPKPSTPWWLQLKGVLYLSVQRFSAAYMVDRAAPPMCCGAVARALSRFLSLGEYVCVCVCVSTRVSLLQARDVLERGSRGLHK